MNEEPSIRSVDCTIREAESLLDRGEVRAAIDILTSANRSQRHPAFERALVHVRHAGCAHLPAPGGGRAPIAAQPADGAVLEIAAGSLTAAHVREGLSRSGCLLVRDLVPADRIERFVTGTDETFAAYDASVAGGPISSEWYEPFPMPALISPEGADGSVVVAPGSPPARDIPVKAHRRLSREGAGVWTVDSPHMLFELFELVDDTGVGAVICETLGERPLLSANKCNLRRVEPVIVEGGWHQDGAFLGNDVAALNLWITLTPCGRDAPGLDIVPKRYDRILAPGGEKAYFKWSLSDEDVAASAGSAGIVRPEFGAGDALLFDHRLVHRTATSPDMVNPRHAIEAWFFGPSAFPASQLPLVY